jgi:hypothetical protein
VVFPILLILVKNLILELFHTLRSLFIPLIGQVNNYHDSLNPCLEGSVYVSAADEVGHNFKLSSGANLPASVDAAVADGQVSWNTSKHDEICSILNQLLFKQMKLHL